MNQYETVLKYVKEKKTDRTSVGPFSIFGYQMNFNLKEGFTLITTKKMHLKSIIHELLCFLRGDKNIQYLRYKDVTVCDEWTDNNGDSGHLYSYQLRNWPKLNGDYIDQIAKVIQLIKNNLDSRRILVSEWNVADVGEMKLPPYHVIFQFYFADGKISRQMYQRSTDMYLGVPFNITSNALLTKIVGQVCDLEPYELINKLGDIYIYLNHIDQVNKQLCLTSRSYPKMNINKNVKGIFSFSYEDFQLKGYEPYPFIKAPIAV